MLEDIIAACAWFTNFMAIIIGILVLIYHLVKRLVSQNFSNKLLLESIAPALLFRFTELLIVSIWIRIILVAIQ